MLFCRIAFLLLWLGTINLNVNGWRMNGNGTRKWNQNWKENLIVLQRKSTAGITSKSYRGPSVRMINMRVRARVLEQSDRVCARAWQTKRQNKNVKLLAFSFDYYYNNNNANRGEQCHQRSAAAHTQWMEEKWSTKNTHNSQTLGQRSHTNTVNTQHRKIHKICTKCFSVGIGRARARLHNKLRNSYTQMKMLRIANLCMRILVGRAKREHCHESYECIYPECVILIMC